MRTENHKKGKSAAHKAALAILAALLVVLFSASSVQAGGPFFFIQEQWSGEGTPNSAQHPGNMTGWTEFSSKDPNITIINNLEDLTVSETILSWLQTDDSGSLSGFNAAGSIFSNIEITGSGIGAGLSLTNSAGAYSPGGSYESVVFDTGQSSNITSTAWTAQNQSGSLLFDFVFDNSLGFISAYDSSQIFAEPSAVRLSHSGMTQANTKALWHFDNSTDPAVDSSANANNGALSGATWIPGGKLGGAVNFDGNDYISVPDSTSLDIGGELTIELWIWINSTSGRQTIASKYKSVLGQRGVRLWFNNSSCPQQFFFTISFGGGPENGASICSNTSIVANRWYHLAAVFKPLDSMKIFIDGVDVSNRVIPSADVPFQLNRNNLPLLLGRDHTGSDFFKGKMDELIVYNQALGSADINAHASLPYPTTSPTLTTIPLATAVTSLTSFEATTVEETGVTSVTYQLLSNDGTTWFYWNGSSWVDGGNVNFNTLQEVNTGLADFTLSPEGTTIQIRVALNTQDPTKTPELSSIRLGYDYDIGSESVIMSVGAGDVPTPDGTWVWQQVAQSSSIVPILSKRYVQYKVDMSSTDDNVTPFVPDVLINYNHVLTNPAVLISSPYDTTSLSTVWNDLVWVENISGTSTVRLQLRTALDSGGVPDWTGATGWAGPDGTESSFFTDSAAGCAKAGSQVTCQISNDIFQVSDSINNAWVQYRAVLTADGVNYPVLSNVNIGYSFGPVVISVSPDNAPNSAAATITVGGSEFSGATNVFFDTSPTLTELSIVPDSITNTGLQAVVPAGVATGEYNVMVSTPGGTNKTSLVRFTVTGVPAVISTSPVNYAEKTLNTDITIHGDGFILASKVELDDPGSMILTNVVVVDDDTITATVPAGVLTGSYNIIVTTPGGSNSASQQLFNITDIPVVDAISPVFLSNNSAQSVTITGDSFTLASEVRFTDTAGTVLTNLTVVDDDTITATVPAGVATGTYDIIVTTPSGSNTASAAKFDSIAVPIVTIVFPPLALSSAQTPVRITGDGFSMATGVRLTDPASTELTNMVVVDDDTITATVPAGIVMGVYIIKVRNVVGESSTGPQLTITPDLIVIPDKVGEGAEGLSMVIEWPFIKTGATVSFEGSWAFTSSTAVVPGSHMEVSLDVAPEAGSGPRIVTIFNPDNEGISHGTFTVIPKPSVMSLSPSQVQQGARNIILDIYISAMQTGITLDMNASGAGIVLNSIEEISYDHIKADISIDPGASAGIRQIATINPDGGRDTYWLEVLATGGDVKPPSQITDLNAEVTRTNVNLTFDELTLSDPSKIGIKNGVVQLLSQLSETVPEENTMALWHFNEGSGTTVNDSSIFNNTGTLTGAKFISAGKFSEAVTFDGNDYITVANSSSLSVNGDMTIEAWIKLSSTSTSQTILSKYKSVDGERGYRLGFNPASSSCSGFFLTISFGGGSENGATACSSGAAVDANTWYHVAAVFKAGISMDIYLNGEKITAPTGATIPGSINVNPLALLIGKDHSNTKFLRGVIDELVIYNRALAPAEIVQHVIDVLSPTETVISFTQIITSPVDSWTNFQETATIPANTSIGYQLYDSNDLTWKYWNKTELKWWPAGADNYSPAADIGPEISSFPVPLVGGSIKVWARLSNTDSSSTPLLTKVNMEYIYMPPNSITAGSIDLHWTAPGNNGTAGTATGYDIRRSSTAILDDGAFDGAVQVQNNISPLPAGSTELFKVTNLTADTDYCFAIKAFDLQQNYSPLSNSTCARTKLLGTGDDTISPAPVSNMHTGFISDVNLKLLWMATGDDGVEGQAARYIIKFSGIEIKENGLADGTFSVDFYDAPEIENNIIPGLPLITEESIVVTSLTPGRDYYFAIKAVDAAGNMSAMSILSATMNTTDNVDPAGVTNMAVFSIIDNSFTVSWTSSGDDENTGRAFMYDMRYSSASINDANFNAATQAMNLPVPAEPGVTEQYTLTGLSSNSTYYIALKVMDEQNNESSISYISAATLLDTISPSAITDLGGTLLSDNAIELSWTATGDSGNSGSAALYDIRYSLVPIVANGTGDDFLNIDFDNAWQVDNNILPALAGQNESLLIAKTHSPVAGLFGFEFDFNDTALYQLDVGSIIVDGKATLQISPLEIPLSTNPNALWHFNEVSGTTVNDSSTFNNTGTLTGATLITGGKFSGAVKFDGNDYMTVANSSSLSVSGDMTIGGWIKLSSTSTSQTILSKYKSVDGERGYRLGFNPASSSCPGFFLTISFGGGPENGATACSSGAAVDANKWYHVAVVFKAGISMDIYLNGEKITAPTGATIPGSINVNPLALLIGKDHSNTKFLRGTIDELVIYGRALTQSEIITYNGLQYTIPEAAVITPSIFPSVITGLASFVAGESTPSGTSIRYQLSNDNGDNWRYWDASANLGIGAWVLVTDQSQYNGESTVNTKITGFPAAGSGIRVKAFLITTDPDVTPSLDFLRIGYDYQLDATLTPETTYYFAIKAIDEATPPNLSPINTNGPVGLTTGTADIASPAAIGDLSAIFDINNDLQLLWSAVGDDGLTGRARTYDIRYSEALITEASFDTATIAASPPDPPQASGAAETFAITGLDLCKSYYVAIKVIDEADNPSPISSCPNCPATLPESACPKDETNPADITTFAASGSSTDSVTLSWIAVGDDGVEGTAMRYDIRYSEEPINGTNFTDASAAANAAAPLPAGDPETLTIQPLKSSTLYYFAIKVFDEVDNVSGISLVSTSTTADLGFPGAISTLTVDLDSIRARTLLLSWSATGDDGYSGRISSYDLRFSKDPITTAEFATSPDIIVNITPQPATDEGGATNIESFTVDKKSNIYYLESNTAYYFAIRAVDDVDRTSAMTICGNCPVQTKLMTGFNMVSVPGVLLTNSPDEVFGDDVGIPFTVREWISDGLTGGAWVYPIVITPGKGYFLYSPADIVSIDVPADAAVESSAVFEISLNAGWTIIATPYDKAQLVKNLSVARDGGATKTFEDAVISGWINNTIYIYNGITYDPLIFNGTPEARLEPWKSYWLEVLDDTAQYKLVIPKPN